MKKRSLALLVALILLLSFVLTSCGSAIFPYNVYRLSPDVCGVVISGEITPQSFVETEGADTELYNGYTYATVDKDGYLILVLSNDQRDQWKQSDFGLRILATLWEGKRDIGVTPFDLENDFLGDPLSELEKILYEGALESGLELSDDYRTVIGETGDNTFYFPWFMHMGVFMQLLEGVPSDEIRVEYIEYGANGDVVERVVWPDDADESGNISTSQ